MPTESVVSPIQRALDESGVAGTAAATTIDGVASYSISVTGQHSELNDGVLVTQDNSETNALTALNVTSRRPVRGFSLFSVISLLVWKVQTGVKLTARLVK